MADQIFDAERGRKIGGLARGQVALDVFAENVDFEVDGVAGGAVADIGVLIGVGDDGDVGDGVFPAGDGEANAVDGNGALRDDIPSECSGDVNAEEPALIAGGVRAFRSEAGDSADRIHVTEDEVAAEFFAGGEWLLEVYAGASFQKRERSFG